MIMISSSRITRSLSSRAIIALDFCTLYYSIDSVRLLVMYNNYV